MESSKALPDEKVPLSAWAGQREIKDVSFSQREKFTDELLQIIVELICQERVLQLKALIENLEKCIILTTLVRVNGNQREAAKVLGVKYTTLNEKMKRYRIHFQKKFSGNS